MNHETLLTRADSDAGEGLFDSIAWALDKISHPDTGQFNSAILYGSEDCPSRIEFFTQSEPRINDKPAWTWWKLSKE